MNNAMPNKAGLKIESFIAIVIGTLIDFGIRMFISIAIIRVKLIMFLGLDFRMTADNNPIIHAITCEAEVLLRLIFGVVVRIVAGKWVG
jgi:hypothetical protein